MSIVVPCVVLVTAYFLVPHLAAFPAALAGIGSYATYGVIAVAGTVSLAFKRGRVVFALLTLAIAYAAQGRYLRPVVPEHVIFAVFGALCLFVPFNLAGLSLLKERGTFNRHGVVRLAVIALQAALTAWAALPGNAVIREWLYATPVSPSPWGASALPQVGLAAIALSVLIAGAVWYRTRSAIDLALAAAAVAFGVAAYGVTVPGRFGTFIAAGVLVLAIGVLQDTFRMAFRDELTGLPGRRALNERLAAIGGRYTIAMLDVDHFKNLNDTHGHDIGDQVLKLAASRIARVRGGGEAYRFGGEEFTVVFPGRDLASAVPHLEALREEIANYRMEMRHSARKSGDRSGGGKQARARGGQPISVTVSIGVAQSGERLGTPNAVVQAADRALYRAKEKGRNRLSR